MTRLVRFDWAIKYLLRNKANFDILEGFLSELLKTDIKIESILESESNKNHADDKYNRVDVLVKTAQERYIIVEVQCSNQWDYLSRILYGTSKIICDHIREGDPYKKISKVISVSIVFFNLGAGKDYLYRGSTAFKGLHYGDTLDLNRQEQKIYQAAHPALDLETPEDIFPEYYIIKITQFHERVEDKIDEWIYFLKHGEIKQEFSAQGIQSAATKLNMLSLSEEERRLYEKYKEASHDTASFNEMMDILTQEAQEKGQAEGLTKGLEEGLNKGLAEGLNKGLAEGEAKGRREIAASLKRAGLSDEAIAIHTGLSLEEIKRLTMPVGIS